jgi:ascorbate PTS system EIIC component
VVNSLEPLGTMILESVGARGVVPTNEAIVAIAAGEFGTTVAWVMLVGFATNLILARVTPLKYIFLTGHHIWFMATMLAVVLFAAEIEGLINILLAGVLLGVIMVAMPALGHPFMRRITGDQPVAIGHFGTLGYIAAGLAGKYLGGRSRSTEEMSFPRSFNFLRDAMVATAVVMIVIYVVFAIWFAQVASPAQIAELTEGDLIVFAVTQALFFAAGVAVILLGVRTILGEVVPAFAGIANRIVPNAMPALDCPVTFPFAPTAVIVGFLASFVGGLLGLGILAVTAGLGPLALALILPGMVPHFFTGGTAGVFGNAMGGRVGAVIGGFVNGLIITFGAAFLMPVMGLLGFEATTFGDADFQWYGIVVGNIANLGAPLLYVLLGVFVAAFLAFAIWVQLRFVPPPDYGAQAEAAAAPTA